MWSNLLPLISLAERKGFRCSGNGIKQFIYHTIIIKLLSYSQLSNATLLSMKKREYAECRLYEIYEQFHDGSTPDIRNKMDGSLSFFELFMCFLSTFSGSVYTQQLYWRASNNRNSSVAV